VIEIVTAVLTFLSISVFLAHAFDAYRTDGLKPRRPDEPVLHLGINMRRNDLAGSGML
jgi:hypothetical protein